MENPLVKDLREKAMSILFNGSTRNLLREAAVQIELLEPYKKAYEAYDKKTEWVQKTGQSHELGMHRADVLKQRIENLEAELMRMRGRELKLQMALDTPESQENLQEEPQQASEGEAVLAGKWVGDTVVWFENPYAFKKGTEIFIVK